MKKTLLFSLTLLLCVLSNAQDVSNLFVSESETVKFEESKGLFIKREIFDDKYNVLPRIVKSFSPAMLTDLRTKEREPYVYVGSLVPDGGKNISRTSVIDYDEISSVIEALEYIINDFDLNDKPTYKDEVFIKTRDGLVIGVQADLNVLNEKKKWTAFILHSKYLVSNTKYYKTTSLSEWVTELKDAKTLLDEKMK